MKGRERIQANMLSSGDKQRIAIARSLINDPKLLNRAIAIPISVKMDDEEIEKAITGIERAAKLTL